MSPRPGSPHAPRRKRLASLGPLALLVAASACAERAEPPENVALGAADVTGWDRVAAVPHDDVHDYDQVAAAPTEDGVVWFTRAGEGSESLAVWSVSGGQPPVATDVATPGAVTIPVGVAADLTGSWLVGTSSSGDVPRDGGRDVRAVAATGSGPLVGLVTERAGIDVEVWRSPGSRN